MFAAVFFHTRLSRRPLNLRSEGEDWALATDLNRVLCEDEKEFCNFALLSFTQSYKPERCNRGVKLLCFCCAPYRSGALMTVPLRLWRLISASPASCGRSSSAGDVADHDSVAIRQCTLPLSREVCSPLGRTEFHLFSFFETNRRIPSQHTDLSVVYTVFFVTPPLSRHLLLSEPLIKLCTSPGQIGPRPRRVVVRKREHEPCLAERGDAEWRPELCLNPLYRSRRTF